MVQQFAIWFGKFKIYDPYILTCCGSSAGRRPSSARDGDLPALLPHCHTVFLGPSESRGRQDQQVHHQLRWKLHCEECQKSIPFRCNDCKKKLKWHHQSVNRDRSSIYVQKSIPFNYQEPSTYRSRRTQRCTYGSIPCTDRVSMQLADRIPCTYQVSMHLADRIDPMYSSIHLADGSVLDLGTAGRLSSNVQ